ncbi:3-ketoacyl-CoA thiolase with broad chain length specificity [Mitosporidium daphniae]|uniref:acetyl-CoA C-acyltransferase n=1 Tax=Mitosporidium daphniae TaxID=1485682 RepID=A0A098VNY8_9MICR|nr:uncharacterized protein DI09_57p130 [Mitosporidium daphniae]KGG50758.1 hypothetical protein DI09_57p130 [Mitosporidium daphniae]|eukprot:XP_013237185.1 uncharacterized protein DI09_57p130 [Mitosporidium daphniae]
MPIASDNDVVICGAVRTPLQRAYKGKFKELHPEDLLAAALKGLVRKTGINPNAIQDIAVGTVLTPGGGATAARMAAFSAGFPETCSIMTVNRQCSSGLQAIAAIASSITSGQIDIGIGAGMESMSRNYGDFSSLSFSTDVMNSCDQASDCLMPMGETAEIVAESFGVDRQAQDRFSLCSHQKAARAQQQGLFAEEIIPIDNVTDDDGIRLQATIESLSALKPAFRPPPLGTATAGNSSQITDGAAAVLLARRSTARALGLVILARFCSYAVVGVPPRVMGVGPAYAIPVAVKRASLTLQDIGIFEINEAFASQILYCIRELKIDPERVNPKGGAIAFGHPLGATGARQMATLLPEMRRQGARYGVISMCIGTGMGAAAVIALEPATSRL